MTPPEAAALPDHISRSPFRVLPADSSYPIVNFRNRVEQKSSHGIPHRGGALADPPA